jgi:hypothetical protein
MQSVVLVLLVEKFLDEHDLNEFVEFADIRVSVEPSRPGD